MVLLDQVAQVFRRAAAWCSRGASHPTLGQEILSVLTAFVIEVPEALVAGPFSALLAKIYRSKHQRDQQCSHRQDDAETGTNTCRLSLDYLNTSVYLIDLVL